MSKYHAYENDIRICEICKKRIYVQGIKGLDGKSYHFECFHENIEELPFYNKLI